MREHYVIANGKGISTFTARDTSFSTPQHINLSAKNVNITTRRRITEGKPTSRPRNHVSANKKVVVTAAGDGIKLQARPAAIELKPTRRCDLNALMAILPSLTPIQRKICTLSARQRVFQQQRRPRSPQSYGLFSNDGTANIIANQQLDCYVRNNGAKIT
jgi:hypothetical protein